ncbi:receptor-like protein EIX2 [Cucumis sativus]|uniref:receptor-like protein EIX2 n=1 Tax=Cucumis sativus TaxID=3659 RepID=UPI0005ED1E50|nr:receptor-like protein EIX2 [Cucumis sativus]KAE8647939.1 hypothetical protein Csa_000241 [Cucumis sativus]
MRKLVCKESSVVVSLWMMILLLLLLHFCFSITAAAPCIQKERQALLRFKNSFYDDPSLRLASWNASTDCCNWKGVGCNQITGHVTIIDLRRDPWQVDCYLSPLYSNKSIDSSLFELKYLSYLDLSGNYFDSIQIPSFLGSMVELTYLNLSGTSISSKVLPHLGNLTNLDTLDLSNNYWVDTEGVVEWISHLSSLQFLDLTNMNFSKSLNLMQVLSSLPMLSSLRLSSCSLQNIHFSLSSLNYSSFLSRVQVLDLSNNQLSGSTPKAFQNMSSLNLLNLSANKFTSIEGGLYSSFIENNCGLEVFDFSWNIDFDADLFVTYVNESMGCSNNQYDLQLLNLGYTSIKTKIPDWLGKFKNMKSLDLGYSKIYGPIPASLGNLSSLEYLILSGNALTGAIPTSLGRLLNLRKLHLSNNRLEGVSDECFIQLENLEWLDISKNLLKGILTEAGFANLSRLDALLIDHNEHLSLDMSPNWIPPFQLKFLTADSCIGCFGGEFPQWLQNQKSLISLLLSNVSISSAIPTWFISQNLSTLNLSYNKMTGPIFSKIVDQMPNLSRLFLNDNVINDSLISLLCQLKNLYLLDLSNNRLTGIVEGCLLTPNLKILDLSSNNFFGTFPYSKGDLSYIQQLNLGNNNFEGSMPIVLKNSQSLDTLNLGGNKFSGNIPTWVGNNLESLQLLILRGNLFNGTIPSTLCKLSNLQILDLAHNQLEGVIPPNLSNFNVMTRKSSNGHLSGCEYFDDEMCYHGEKYVVQHIKSSDLNYSMEQTLLVNIDLSKNHLVGSIPSEIIMLKGLHGLNLSNNYLVGPIPAEIGEMEMLESLDLSFNQLSGPIPRSISKLSSLGVLVLSHNNLSGEIYREGHLSTFNEASSFDDNPYLCGDPLPTNCTIKNSLKPQLKSIDNNVDEEDDRWEKWLLYIMIILGFIVGFWTVVGSLTLKKSWRYKYFKFVDEAYYKVHAIIWESIEWLKGISFHK